MSYLATDFSLCEILFYALPVTQPTVLKLQQEVKTLTPRTTIIRISSDTSNTWMRRCHAHDADSPVHSIADTHCHSWSQGKMVNGAIGQPRFAWKTAAKTEMILTLFRSNHYLHHVTILTTRCTLTPQSVNVAAFTTLMSALTLKFDLQNLTRTLVGASGYSL